MRLIPERLRTAPAAIVVTVLLLLLAGLGAIAQNEASYRRLQAQETGVQAEILAASVTAPLDFGDAEAAQEAVQMLRVSRQIRTVAVYDQEGALVAGYARQGAAPPPQSEREPQPGLDTAIAASVPVIARGERIGTVHLTLDPEPLTRRITRWAVIGLLVLMAALVVTVLGVGQAALRRANRQLEDRAEALGRAYAELQVQIEERAKAEEQLRQAQKMQALGQLTGGIAHDFNNLLTVIQGSADLLAKPDLPEPKRMLFAEAIQRTSHRAAALTGQLLAFARRQPLRPEVIDVNALIGGMTDLLDRTIGERITVNTVLDPAACTVEADRTQLESAILNIAVNARDAMDDGGTLTIATRPLREADGPAMIAIEVADSGAGMDEETLNRAFEPFFTTKGTGKGTGLGLSQVYGFATQSGGDVRIDSAPGAGTRVTILMPCSDRAPAEEAAAEAGSERPRTLARILVVEDNEEVGTFAEGLLGELGHDVIRARSGAEALDRIAAERFDLVFSDIVMPGMSGIELSERLAAEQPGLAVVLTTGYSDELQRSGTGGRLVMLKPYRLEALADAIEAALQAGPLEADGS